MLYNTIKNEGAMQKVAGEGVLESPFLGPGLGGALGFIDGHNRGHRLAGAVGGGIGGLLGGKVMDKAFKVLNNGALPAPIANAFNMLDFVYKPAGMIYGGHVGGRLSAALARSVLGDKKQ